MIVLMSDHLDFCSWECLTHFHGGAHSDGGGVEGRVRYRGLTLDTNCVCVCVCYCKIWLIDGEQRGLISSRRQFLWLLCLGTSVSSHYKDKHPLMQLKLLLKTGHEDGIYADH